MAGIVRSLVCLALVLAGASALSDARQQVRGAAPQDTAGGEGRSLMELGEAATAEPPDCVLGYYAFGMSLGYSMNGLHYAAQGEGSLTPDQRAVAERANQQLVATARSLEMLQSAPGTAGCRVFQLPAMDVVQQLSRRPPATRAEAAGYLSRLTSVARDVVAALRSPTAVVGSTAAGTLLGLGLADGSPLAALVGGMIGGGIPGVVAGGIEGAVPETLSCPDGLGTEWSEEEVGYQGRWVRVGCSQEWVGGWPGACEKTRLMITRAGNSVTVRRDDSVYACRSKDFKATYTGLIAPDGIHIIQGKQQCRCEAAWPCLGRPEQWSQTWSATIVAGVRR